MALYHCLYSTCSAYKKPVEVGQYALSLCESCGKQMASAEPPPSPRFVVAQQRVMDEMKNAYNGSYQKQVVEYVASCAAFFQEDFWKEMGRGTELTKFCGTTRTKDPDKVCVDNALAAANHTGNRIWPEGEKFTFEVPFIMQRAGWVFLNGPADIFTRNFKQFRNVAEANSMYLMCAKQRNNEIGHMIVLTIGNSVNAAWISDKQKQPNDYGIYEYIAWKAGVAPQNPPRPYRSIDLDTGRMSGAWTD